MSKIKNIDIAERLNISPTSVSLALNNRPGISEKTRQLVFQTLNELTTQQTSISSKLPQKSIALVVFKRYELAEDNPGFWQVFSTISEVCQNRSFSFSNMTIEEENFSIKQLEQYDGAILWGIQMNRRDFELLHDIKIPVVIIDNLWGTDHFDTVTPNISQSLHLAVSYLVKCNHSKIGYIRGQQPLSDFTHKFSCFKNILEDYKIPLNPDWIFEVNPTSPSSSYESFMKILKNSPSLPTAFLCDNDLVALGCLRALTTCGYQVPDDISIIGFGNISSSFISSPSLTTINAPSAKIARYAVNLLIGRIQDPSSDFVKIEVGTTLEIRESVKKII